MIEFNISVIIGESFSTEKRTIQKSKTMNFLSTKKKGLILGDVIH